MKLTQSIFILVILPFIAVAQRPVPAAYSPFSKINYVRVWEASAPEPDPGILVTRPLRDVKLTTSFFDGLGRPLQTVVRQGSLPTGNSAVDMIVPVEYDEYGRQQFKYLPAAANNAGGNTSVNDGQFKRNPFQQQELFMQQQYGAQGETFFYGQTVYEQSPLNRSLEVFAAGNNWMGTAGNTSEAARRSEKIKYLFNTTTDDVRKWRVDDVAYNLSPYTPTGSFGAGELYKTVITDEHGKQVIEFRDKEKNLMLKKAQLTAAADPGTGSDYTGWLCTYYIYDQHNNLRCVIQPEAVKQMAQSGNWLPDAAMLAEQCYRYEYDERRRLIIKKVPGAGETYYVYDRWDRMILTQTAKMRFSNAWFFTKYDKYNRPIMVGNHGDAEHTSLAAMIDHVKQNESWQIRYESIDYSKTHGYTTTQTYPYGDNPSILTVTYYDNYDWIATQGNGLSGTLNTTDINGTNFITSYNSAPYFAQELQQSNATTGLITGIKTASMPIAVNMITVNIYDKKGRIIQLQTTNHINGKEIITTQYDFNSRPLRTMVAHQTAAPNVQTYAILSKFEYDDLGRLLSVKKTINASLPGGATINKPETEIVKNEYNAAGQLKTKYIGRKKDGSGNYNSTPLETLSYDYNIRTWLLGVNRSYLSDAGTGKFFGFEIGYDKIANSSNRNFLAAQYNGNINGVVWKSSGDGIQRKYDFSYDAVNRLLKGDFEQHNPDNSWNNAQVNYNIKLGDGSDVTSAYDANGNIKRLQHWGLKLTGSAQVDDLAYSYFSGSSKLQAVADNSAGGTLPGGPATNLGDFTDKNTAGNDYGYDLSGNMITDLNKGMNGTTGTNLTSGGNITYNYLNLPRQMVIRKPDNTLIGTVIYDYDAVGNKLKKTTIDFSVAGKTTTVTTHYAGTLVFETKTTNPADAGDYTERLQYISHEEGRTRFTPADGISPARLDHDYFIKDYLGNVRIVLTDEQLANIYQAGIETANRSFEVALFGDKINSTANGKPGGFDSDGANQQVSRVNGTTAEGRVGPGVILKVMAGDKIKALTYAWYQPVGMDNTTDPTLPAIITNLLGQLVPGIAFAGKGVVAEQATNAILEPALQGFLSGQNPASGAPKAYLNWVLLDDQQFKMVNTSSGTVPVPQITGSQPKQLIQANSGGEIEMKRNGYLYVFVSNESKGNVYFDDIRVEHIRGPLIEETHYYPFGLTMAGISSKSLVFGNPANKRKYQGYEYTSEFDVNLYESFYRTHDPQLGRFWQVDPKPTDGESPYAAMGNNPIRNTDFLGDKLKGVSQQSADRQLQIILNSFQGADAEELRKLFKLKGREFRSIDKKKFEAAVAKLSSEDAKKLAEGWFTIINDKENTAYVSVISADKKEYVGDDIQDKKAKELFANKPFKRPSDGSVFVMDANYTEYEKSGGGKTVVDGKNSFSIIVMDTQSPTNYCDKPTDMVRPQPAQAGETAAHEVLGHALGVFLGNKGGSAADDKHAVNYSNLFLRAVGIKSRYRDGSDHGKQMSEQEASALPQVQKSDK